MFEYFYEAFKGESHHGLKVSFMVCQSNSRFSENVSSATKASSPASSSLTSVQCDQIWRNFAALKKHLKSFCKSFQVFGSLFKIGHILNLLWQNIYAIGQMFIVVIGQVFKNIHPSGHTASVPTSVTCRRICNDSYDWIWENYISKNSLSPNPLKIFQCKSTQCWF